MRTTLLIAFVVIAVQATAQQHMSVLTPISELERTYIDTLTGEVLTAPLEAFPALDRMTPPNYTYQWDEAMWVAHDRISSAFNTQGAYMMRQVFVRAGMVGGWAHFGSLDSLMIGSGTDVLDVFNLPWANGFIGYSIRVEYIDAFTLQPAPGFVPLQIDYVWTNWQPMLVTEGPPTGYLGGLQFNARASGYGEGAPYYADSIYLFITHPGLSFTWTFGHEIGNNPLPPTEVDVDDVVYPIFPGYYTYCHQRYYDKVVGPDYFDNVFIQETCDPNYPFFFYWISMSTGGGIATQNDPNDQVSVDPTNVSGGWIEVNWSVTDFQGNSSHIDQELKIVDLMGRTVHTFQSYPEMHLDISWLATGHYLVRDDANNLTRRFNKL